MRLKIRPFLFLSGFLLALTLTPLHGQVDTKSPSEQTIESLQSTSQLPSETSSPELRAKPPGGDPIGGIDSPVGDYPVYLILLSVVAYGFYRFREVRRTKNI